MAKRVRNHEHDGHRRRMKERFLREGLEHMPPHEVIEILLYYAIPYRDTNELAHRLVNTFGTVQNVLGADYADLLKVEGVTPHIATLIHFSSALALRCIRESYEPGDQLIDGDEFVEAFIPWFVGEKEESIVMISMDGRRKVLNTTRLFRGSANSAQFNHRIALKQALQDNATVIAFAHNHPNGFALPSRADLISTVEWIEFFASMDIRVADHVIISQDDGISMAATRAFAPMFDIHTPLEEMRTLSQRFDPNEYYYY